MMTARSDKAKQYLLAALKVFVLGITFGFVYLKLTDNEGLSLAQFANEFTEKSAASFWSVFLFLLLAGLNWILEILKWKEVISAIRGISFPEAARQSLAALTVSLATPNRIGDYGAKAMFYEAPQRRRVLVLNFFSSGVQMAVTSIFGIIGLIIVAQNYGVTFSTTNLILGGIIILLLLVVGYLFKEKQLLLRGLSIGRVMGYILDLPSQVKASVVLLSLLRYLVFTFLFYLLLGFFGVSMPLIDAVPIIFAMYFLVSILPSVLLLDVVIRGGVAVWLFSLAGISELPVLCTVLAMWLLNFVLPAIWGSFYVAGFKPKAS